MSLDIGKLFHVVHASEELGPLDAWYDRVFAPRRGIMDADFLARDLRDGSLVAIGDAIVETMAPAARPGAAASPIGRFVGRFGRHLHSLAWYTEDVGAIWERLTGHGIRVVATFAPEGGRPPEGDIYAHPKDAITQLEFFQPPRSGGGPTASPRAGRPSGRAGRTRSASRRWPTPPWSPTTWPTPSTCSARSSRARCSTGRTPA